MFVYIVENTSHDTLVVVVRIIEHTLKSLKEENPIFDTASLHQDNAECYHSSAMILSCALMKANTGIDVRRVYFNDPLCDCLFKVPIKGNLVHRLPLSNPWEGGCIKSCNVTLVEKLFNKIMIVDLGRGGRETKRYNVYFNRSLIEHLTLQRCYNNKSL